ADDCDSCEERGGDVAEAAGVAVPAGLCGDGGDAGAGGGCRVDRWDGCCGAWFSRQTTRGGGGRGAAFGGAQCGGTVGDDTVCTFPGCGCGTAGAYFIAKGAVADGAAGAAPGYDEYCLS